MERQTEGVGNGKGLHGAIRGGENVIDGSEV